MGKNNELFFRKQYSSVQWFCQNLYHKVLQWTLFLKQNLKQRPIRFLPKPPSSSVQHCAEILKIYTSFKVWTLLEAHKI